MNIINVATRRTWAMVAASGALLATSFILTLLSNEWRTSVVFCLSMATMWVMAWFGANQTGPLVAIVRTVRLSSTSESDE